MDTVELSELNSMQLLGGTRKRRITVNYSIRRRESTH